MPAGFPSGPVGDEPRTSQTMTEDLASQNRSREASVYYELIGASRQSSSRRMLGCTFCATATGNGMIFAMTTFDRGRLDEVEERIPCWGTRIVRSRRFLLVRLRSFGIASSGVSRGMIASNARIARSRRSRWAFRSARILVARKCLGPSRAAAILDWRYQGLDGVVNIVLFS